MNGSPTALHIDAVDAFARTLYLRTKQIPPPSFDDAAVAVRQMHISLRHLRGEAADAQSVLNKPDSAVYTRQLQPIVEDCEFALKQLDTVLARYENATGPPDVAALADRIASVTAKIAHEEMNVAFFLDTVQVRPSNTTNKESTPPPAHATLDEITEEMDVMASRVFTRHAGTPDTDSEAIWREFRAELLKEDFTSDELDTHKTAIRVYIRKLGSAWHRNCGTNPTYQTVAEFEANTAPQVVRSPVHVPAVPPKIPIIPPKETQPSPVGANAIPGVKDDGHLSDKLSATVLPSQYSFNAPADMELEKRADLSMTLISTKDLVTMDSMNNGMSAMKLNSTSPQTQHSYLAPNRPDGLSHSPTSQMLAASPRYHSANPSDPSTAQQNYRNTSPNRPMRLAPDRYGREIPLDAEWTKVRRTLISPEALDNAGVRYEARPDYVAILGRLTRDEIAELARKSAECRSARSPRPPLPPRRENSSGYDGYDDEKRRNPDSKNHLSDDDILYDSDSTDYEPRERHQDKGTKSYPIIVNAPTKTSPSTNVKPKPILKNRGEKTHVRFDPEPQEFEHSSSAPSSYNHDRRRDYYSEGNSSRRSRGDHHDRDHHDRNDRHYRSGGGSSSSHHRDRRDRPRKKSWGETLGAVGIGSAALLLGGGF